MFDLVRSVGGIAAGAALALLLPAPALAEPFLASATDSAAVAAPDPARPYPGSAQAAPRFSVPVEGLTEMNADLVIEEMEALGEQLGITFSRITPDLENGTVTFSFPENNTVYFFDVENTLENADVTVRSDALWIPVGARLILVGDTDPEAVAGLRKALEKARLFESFVLRADEDAGDVTLVPVMKTAMMHSKLAAEIKKKTGYRLTDFAWVRPPAPKPTTLGSRPSTP